MTDRTQASLHAARLAHKRRTQSVDAYRQAIEAATRSGATYTDIARTLGITRQAVRQYTLTNT
jgi:transposase-like protein